MKGKTLFERYMEILQICKTQIEDTEALISKGKNERNNCFKISTEKEIHKKQGNNTRALSRENMSSEVCDQVTLKPACSASEGS